MSKVTSSWARPIQGVSQQPPKSMKEGQCREQINMIPSAVRGLEKRTGTEHIRKILDSISPDAFVHHYLRDDSEEYFIIIEPDGLPKVFGVDGRAHVVTSRSGAAYRVTTNPNRSLALCTIADYTFLVNRDKVVAKALNCTAPLVNEAMVYLQYATYGRTYSVNIDGAVRASYTTPDGSVASHINNVAINYVSAVLAGQLSSAGYAVGTYGASMHIRKSDGSSFTIITEDGAQGKDLVAIPGIAHGIANLPPEAPDGIVIRVQGQGQRLDDAYWMRANNEDGITRWVESLEPGTLTTFDPNTMPQTLIRESVDEFGIATFTVGWGTWTSRDVGNDDTNPFPSFMDNKINSIGIFQNRLFFTSMETVCMTRTGQFFNFFRESTQLSVDDDPIDVYADSPQINELMHSVALDGDLVLFSPTSQFLLKGDKPITKANITLKHTNSFAIQTTVSPVPTGESIYFAFDSGRYTGIRELFTDNIVDTKRARAVTEHVDRFIQGPVRSMSSSTNQDWLLIMADAPNIIYVYNWVWVGQEKAQSAWHRWVWPEDERIEKVTMSQDKLYFIISRAEGVYLECIQMGDADTTGLPYPARLDRLHTVTATRVGSYFTFPDTFPDEPVENLEYILSTGAYPEYIGVTMVFERLNGVLITYDEIGEGETCTLVGGVKFTSTFTPAQPTVKDYRERVIETDKLRLAQVYLNYETTGYLKVSVKDKYGNVDVNEFNGRVFGDVNNTVGFSPLIDGQFCFPVLQLAEDVTIEITSDSYLPLRIRDMEFTGQFTQRGRRI